MCCDWIIHTQFCKAYWPHKSFDRSVCAPLVEQSCFWSWGWRMHFRERF